MISGSTSFFHSVHSNYLISTILVNARFFKLLLLYTTLTKLLLPIFTQCLFYDFVRPHRITYIVRVLYVRVLYLWNMLHLHRTLQVVKTCDTVKN